ncbi:MAG TPA: hypothetical protein VF188_11510 [Longimicrobiales bacterium]
MSRSEPDRPESASDAAIQRLDDAEAAAIETLVAAYAELDVSTPLAPLANVPVDLVASLFEEPEPLLEAMWTLARRLTGRVIGAADAADDEALERARRAVDEARIALAGNDEAVPSAPDIRDMLLPYVAELIREVGLEAFDASVVLAAGRDGRSHMAWHPVPAETALVWLQGRLFDRLEAFALTDGLLRLERRASRWIFDRWSPPLRFGDREAVAFTRNVREREWSLTEHDTLRFGQPVLHAFCDRPLFDLVPARQQRLARAMRGAVAGVFTVASHDGDDVVFEGPLDRRRYRVHEHNTDARYEAGFVAIGRLIPLGEGRWLRSPGMLIFKTPAADAAHQYAETFERGRGVPPTIRMEGLIGAVAGRRDVPRDVPPAASPAEALALLQTIRQTLEEHGLVEEVEPGQAPPELLAPEGEERRYFGFRVDDEMAAWIAALAEQARSGRGPGRRGGRRPARVKKRRGRKR